MRNCKLGITMYIITFILIIFAFWLVGCNSDTSSGLNLCANYQTTDSTSNEFSEVSEECKDQGEWF